MVRDLTREHDGVVKTNLILASASKIFGIRYAEPKEPNTLYYLSGEPRSLGGSVIASEPLDDGPGWHEVGPDMLVRADAEGVHLEPLDLDRVARARKVAAASSSPALIASIRRVGTRQGSVDRIGPLWWVRPARSRSA